MKAKSTRYIYAVWLAVLIVWSLYRVLFQLPEWIDELVAKPIVFVGLATAAVLVIEKKSFASLGFSKLPGFKHIYISLSIGMVFAFVGLAANLAKNGAFSFAPLVPVTGLMIGLVMVTSFAASFSEELFARGFLYTRFREHVQHKGVAFVVSAVLFLLLHIPIVFLVSRLSGVALDVFVMNNLLLSAVNTFVYEETGSLTIPILLHMFWNMTVILYL